jgi:hypothetical protein
MEFFAKLFDQIVLDGCFLFRLRLLERPHRMEIAAEYFAYSVFGAQVVGDGFVQLSFHFLQFRLDTEDVEQSCSPKLPKYHDLGVPVHELCQLWITTQAHVVCCLRCLYRSLDYWVRVLHRSDMETASPSFWLTWEDMSRSRSAVGVALRSRRAVCCHFPLAVA